MQLLPLLFERWKLFDFGTVTAGICVVFVGTYMWEKYTVVGTDGSIQWW
jgi:hypothetical protein